MMLLACSNNHKPDLSLSTYVYDFNILDKNIIYEGSAIIKNTGNGELTITHIDAGCICTKASVTKNVIQRGDTCKLNFTYNTQDKDGVQEQIICIVANTDSLVHLLSIKAFVR